MPSTSKKQHNFMAAVANNPAFAKKVGVSKSVGEEFTKADKGRKFTRGGEMANTSRMNRLEELGRVNAERAKTAKGKSNLASEKKRLVSELTMKKGGMAESKKMVAKEVAFMKKKGAPKSMVKHEESEMKGMKKGGACKGYASGGKVSHGEHPVQKKGHTKGRNLGDSGPNVGIQSGARGMKRGGKC